MNRDAIESMADRRTLGFRALLLREFIGKTFLIWVIPFLVAYWAVLGYLVSIWLALLLTIIVFIGIFTNRGKQTLHDKIAKTYVIKVTDFGAGARNAERQ